MKWTTRSEPYDGKWRPWFAWYPVQIGSDRIGCNDVTEYAWLEPVEYKTECGYGDCDTNYRRSQLHTGKECGA